jgi:GNAT superfamily N-acetyltransferase
LSGGVDVLEVIIRQALLEDVDLIDEMIAELMEYETNLLRKLKYDERLINESDLPDATTFIKDEMGGGESRIIVAESNNVIVGFCRGKVKQKGDYSSLNQLYVKAEYQKKGIGTLLVKYFFGLVFENNPKAHVLIPSLFNNELSRKFYSSLGIRETYVTFDIEARYLAGKVINQ